jgi:hypothetical protein
MGEDPIIRDTVRRDARIAGVLYLLVALTAPIGLLYVPGRVVVSDNATATADHLRASEWLVRLGIASELVHQAICVFLVLALYRMFRGVNEYHAKQVVILGALVSVPIMFVNVLNEVAALLLASRPEFLTAFDPPKLDALAYLFIYLHAQGIVVASIFWGLWLFPFGLLVIRSTFVPRVLGFSLMVAGGAYLASAVTTLLAPRYSVEVGRLALPLQMGELPIVVWLLVQGVKGKRVIATA